MTANKYHPIAALLLILVLCASLLNVQVAQADGETPTEPPAATQVATESTVEATPEPVEATPAPEEATPAPEEATPAPGEATPAEEVLTQVPEATEVVVLDESGETVPLATEEAAEIVSVTDPMWCPEGVAPGGAGCTTNFGSIAQLISDMKTNTTNYAQNGVIYFTADATEPLTLTTNSLGWADFQAINDFNLTLQGGWNGDTVSPSFNGQTNFGTNSITIGTSGNPWAGNVTLNALTLDGGSATNAITIFTSTGQVSLNNVEVVNQNGNGARLNAPVVTLKDVTARNDRGNGVLVENASVVTLSNVVASANGKNGSGSGVFVNNVNTGRLIVIGGEFNNNNRNGIQVANATIYVQSDPTCTGNRLACYSTTPIFDNTPPVIAPDITGTVGSNGWYGSDVSVSWSVADAESDILSSNGCDVTNLTGETNGTTLTCSATNKAGISNSVSVTIKIDKSSANLSLPDDITMEATGPSGAVVNYSTSATDAVGGNVPVSCSPDSGSVFPFGTTTVNCSATDLSANTSNGEFTVTVQDTTAPTMASAHDITMDTNRSDGRTVTYTSPSTLDLVDGAGVASCSPASGSLFPIGSTKVTCTATDAHGNTSTGIFFVYVTGSEKTSSVSQSSAPKSITPVTGGGLIDLDCNSVFWAYGIKLSYMNLCDQQTTVHSVSVDDLPGALPEGFSFVMGVSLNVLSNGQSLNELSDGSSIQLDFPVAGSADTQFAVLYWNGSEWTEVSQQSDAASQFLSATTHQPGTFVLVKK